MDVAGQKQQSLVGRYLGGGPPDYHRMCYEVLLSMSQTNPGILRSLIQLVLGFTIGAKAVRNIDGINKR